MSKNLTLERNPCVATSPTIQLGDRVMLHSADVWNYCIRADVQATNGKSITATVVDIFDQDTGAQVLGGDITKFVGTTLKFETYHVFQVLKQ